MKSVKILKHFERPVESGKYFRLVCLTGKNKGKSYYLVGKRVVLGRSDKVDIQILDIKSSREHAEIVTVSGDFILTDLNSQNGIIVNDLKIKQHVLSNGDRIVVGQTVYKCSEILVEETQKIEMNIEENDLLDDKIEPEGQKNKKLTKPLIVVLAVAVLILLFSGDDSKPTKKKKKSKEIHYDLKEISDPFADAIKVKKKANKKNQQKLALYFQRGLREYREGNYFRAMSEFEHARQWSPSDPLAKFYLRKTKEELHNKIDGFFNSAIRASDGLNYQQAVTSYCAVLRLLHSYPKDKRYKDALDGVKVLEGKMGLDEGDIECSQKGEK